MQKAERSASVHRSLDEFFHLCVLGLFFSVVTTHNSTQCSRTGFREHFQNVFLCIVIVEKMLLNISDRLDIKPL